MNRTRPSRIRRRLTMFVVAGGLFLAPFGIGATPASAWTCESEIEDACQVAATLICKVVAKGRPCLY